MKRGMHQGYFLLKGLEKVRGEFSLTVLAYNLKRVLHLVGVPRLLEALASRGLLVLFHPRSAPHGPVFAAECLTHPFPVSGRPFTTLPAPTARPSPAAREFSHGLGAG